MTSQRPPSLPATPYTSYYCEENIFLLAAAFCSSKAVTANYDIDAIFVSNSTKTAVLWRQKIASRPPPDDFVIWDYHVFLLLRPKDGASEDKHCSWVYDFDTALGLPSLAEDYISQTFRFGVLPQWQSGFRVVPAEILLDYFASDRSHMIKNTTPNALIASTDNEDILPSQPMYSSPPPSYPPLKGRKADVDNNLMSMYVNMTIHPIEVVGLGKESRAEKYGKVMDLSAFVDICQISHKIYS